MVTGIVLADDFALAHAVTDFARPRFFSADEQARIDAAEADHEAHEHAETLLAWLAEGYALVRDGRDHLSIGDPAENNHRRTCESIASDVMHASLLAGGDALEPGPTVLETFLPRIRAAVERLPAILCDSRSMAARRVARQARLWVGFGC